MVNIKVGFAVLLAAALAVAPVSAADGEIRATGLNRIFGPPNAFSLVGTWHFDATLKFSPPRFPTSGKFSGTETFNSDGSMHVITNISSSTIGVGSWAQTGPLTYTLTFTFYRLDTTTPITGYLLATVVNENIRMVTPDSYVSTNVIEPLDANNNPLMICPPTGSSICQFPGNVTTTRYPFASFNTVLP